MTLPNIITKLALAAAALAIAALALAACSAQPSNDAEIAALRQEIETLKAAQQQPANAATRTPLPTPTPMPTKTPAPVPTITPTPTATPDPPIDEYYVTLNRSTPNNTIGSVLFCVNYPRKPNNFYSCGIGALFNDEDFFLDYLLRQGTIAEWQHAAYFQGNDVKVYLNDIAPAIYNLVETKGYVWIQRRLGLTRGEIDNVFLHYYDRSDASSDREGLVVIRNGVLETVTTNADGETVRVELDAVDTEDFLDYLYSIGRITGEQREDYHWDRELRISFGDAADALDFFDWTDAANDGISIDSLGIDETDVDYIRRELLPLFQFGD